MVNLSKVRLAAFAAGDFAFNLYWQSAMLYLLFYYTDVLGIPIATAATIYLIASLWDGVASFAIGALAERMSPGRDYARMISIGAAPLGLAFMLAYLPAPAGAGGRTIVMALAGHLLFRTAYALVNLPYLALSAQISADSGDRALVAGFRMLAGTLAAVIVALGTVPLGGWLTGAPGSPRSFIVVAMVFAAIATAMLVPLGVGFRDGAPTAPRAPVAIGAGLRALAANRAFLTLSAAMMATTAAVTMLNKSVLYYFKYAQGDAAGGEIALGAMMAVSAIAVPIWTIVSRLFGARTAWFYALAITGGGLAAFALVEIADPRAIQVLLVMTQAAIVGLHLAFWALLPDTIEYGQRATGLRVEGLTFGLTTLLQRVAIGAATGLLGWILGEAGYVANRAQGADSLAAMRLTVSLAPLTLLVLAGWLMWLNPQRKGAHDRIVAELEG